MVHFRGNTVHSVEKIFDLVVSYKGLSMPVAVYLVEETVARFFYHCVCFEGTRYDRYLMIDKHEHGGWYDLMDRDEELARAIGMAMEAEELQVA